MYEYKKSISLQTNNNKNEKIQTKNQIKQNKIITSKPRPNDRKCGNNKQMLSSDLDIHIVFSKLLQLRKARVVCVDEAVVVVCGEKSSVVVEGAVVLTDGAIGSSPAMIYQ